MKTPITMFVVLLGAVVISFIAAPFYDEYRTREAKRVLEEMARAVRMSAPSHVKMEGLSRYGS